MPIQVITGGPLNGIPSLLATQKATFGAMIADIADDIDDTNNEYLAQIQAAIFSAIRFCEREPFYFNENRDVVLNTSASQAIYDATDHQDIGTMAGITAVYCQKTGQAAKQLQEITPEVWENLTSGTSTTGQPYNYSYFSQTLRLYPTPDSGFYQIRLQLAPKRLSEITSTEMAHPWFKEAFDLIKARAKYELYKNILQDDVLAVASFNDFIEQLQALRAETSRRNGSGKIVATVF